jgi:hypothetical protein
MVVACGTNPTCAASASVPVLTDHLSTPQLGVGEGVGVGLGEGLTPHVIEGVELFLGPGAPDTKSELFRSVSVHPPLILITAVELLGAGAAADPSKQFAVP